METTMIEMMEAQLAKKRNEIEILEQALAVMKGGTAPDTFRPASKEFENISIIDATKKIMAERGVKELDTRTIADALLDRGMRTRSKNYAATVYSTLDNSREFKRTKDGKWVLVEAPKD